MTMTDELHNRGVAICPTPLKTAVLGETILGRGEAGG